MKKQKSGGSFRTKGETIVAKAIRTVPGFEDTYRKFEQHTTLKQVGKVQHLLKSKSQVCHGCDFTFYSATAFKSYLLAFRCSFCSLFFFIFAASFPSFVRWGRQSLLQVLVLAMASETCKCA